MSKWLCVVLVALLAFMAAPAEAKNAKTMTNKDVIALVQAKIAQDSILMAIDSSKTDFDTSPTALIELNKAGVPDTIVQAMMRAGAPKPSIGSGPAPLPAAAGRAAGPAGAFNPEEVLLFDGSQRIAMHYITPETRTAARALGFGGVGAYAVLRGVTAVQKVTSRQPTFIIAVPNNAQPQSYFSLAIFEVRKNGSREVSIGGGYMSYSSGIPKERLIETTAERHNEQAHAPAGFTLYRITPVAPLKDGEYAMIIHSAQVHVAGFFGTGAADSFFDFSIGH